MLHRASVIFSTLSSRPCDWSPDSFTDSDWPQSSWKSKWLKMGGIGGGGGARSGNVDGIDNFSNQLSPKVILRCRYKVSDSKYCVLMLINSKNSMKTYCEMCFWYNIYANASNSYSLNPLKVHKISDNDF